MSKSMRLPSQIFNKSTGLLKRNPSHLVEAESARNQTDIVRAIQGHPGKKKCDIEIDYNEEKKKTTSRFPGFYWFLDENNKRSFDTIKNTFTSVLRFRPTVIQVQTSLADIDPTLMKELNHPKVRAVGHAAPRPAKETAEKIADLLADDTLNVVSLDYAIVSSSDQIFAAEARAWVTDEPIILHPQEEEEEANYSPFLKITYIGSKSNR